MTKPRKRLTYANVMSSIAVFLVLGGASAVAAKKIGSNELKSNSVTTAKLKKNAVTAAKIKKNAVTTAKLKNGAVTGAKVNLSTLGTVPNSATTDEVRSSQGTVAKDQQATAFEYGPFKIVVKCVVYNVNELRARAYIESSTSGSVFTSWEDGSTDLGPATPEAQRELQSPSWGSKEGTYFYDSASDVGVSATAASGQSFTAFVGLASDEAKNTCWYWSTATVIS
ncbi:MAG TPA: hypothetical protein VF093_10255 [Solirubrobacterales bacterium]